MTPELRHVGESRSPVLVIDGFTGEVARIIDAAAALAPFPSIAGNYYPGLRRVIGPADGAALAYVQAALKSVAPLVGEVFGVQGFGCREASFSMVTAAPQSLAPQQRMPHFDSPDPKVIAMLHYLSDTPGTGTGFYRHKATGIEVIDPANVRRFLAAAQAESSRYEGYVQPSNRFFERVGLVEAVPDRMVIYQGRLLHSGVIPPDMSFSDDPRAGRLTANFFLQGA